MKKYYKADDLKNGIWENDIQTIPPFSKTLLRNLRSSRKITYQKIGRECVYTKEALEEYLMNSTVKSMESA